MTSFYFPFFLIFRVYRVRAMAFMRGIVINSQLRRFLHHVYSNEPLGTRVFLLYPEALIFPILFPFVVDGAPVGAMALFQMLKATESKYGVGLANLIQHIRVRIGNSNHPMSMNHEYLFYLASLYTNATLNYHSIHLLQRRGVEFLTVKRSSSCGLSANPNSDGLLEFGEIEDDKKSRELSAMMRVTGSWDFFVTLTCNDKKTPGLVGLWSRICRNNEKWFSKEDKHRAWLTYLPLTIRLWERTVRYVTRWIEHSKDRPFGKVKHIFSRHESQSGGGIGNKMHIHMALIAERPPGMSDEEWRRHRCLHVTCTEDGLWMEEQGTPGDFGYRMGTTPMAAEKNGLARSEADARETLREASVWQVIEKVIGMFEEMPDSLLALNSEVGSRPCLIGAYLKFHLLFQFFSFEDAQLQESWFEV